MRGTLLPISFALAASLTAPAQQSKLLTDRAGFKTKLVKQAKGDEELGKPNDKLFTVAKFKGPLGEMKAWLSKPLDPNDKYPAMIWITGGFPPGGIGESAWEHVGPKNDQSAKDYRLAGMIMMYATVRGSHGNPGVQECFLGEVDDVLAAIKHVKSLSYVDPEQVYVGGHSTGGTLALLVAAATSELRGVFSFGPVADPADYGADNLTYDPKDAKEARVRAPIHYLADIQSPTFVFEGSRGNYDSLKQLSKANKNAKVRVIPVEGANHYDLLAPLNKLIAKQLVRIRGKAPVRIGKKQVERAFESVKIAQREADDLENLARARRDGFALDAEHQVTHYLLGRNRAMLVSARSAAKRSGFAEVALVKREDSRKRAYYVLTMSKKQRLNDLKALFAGSKAFHGIAKKYQLQYNGWRVRG